MVENVTERVTDAVTYALGLGVLVVNAWRVVRYLQSADRVKPPL
jgi:hypothetical protein